MDKAQLFSPLLAFFLFASPPVSAQPPSQSSARYTLRGSVVNSLTGEPIRKASVQVNGTQSKATTTGPDGQFQLEGLPAGSYWVTANRPGYADPQMLGRQIEPVNLGPDSSALVLKLSPLAKISGRVLDTEGEPVANLNVQCLQQVIQQGHKHWQRGQAATTDDAGDYMIDTLMPGKYVVATTQQQVYPGMIADDTASRLIYRKQYYPNSPDFSAAQTIELTPGEDARADITISTVKGTRVFFSVNPPQQWAQVMLSDESGDQVDVQFRRSPKTGAWILPSIPPGSWRLQVTANNNGGQLSGEASIEVGDTDLKNVVVTLSSQTQVPIVFTGASGNASPPANVQLVPSSGNLNGTIGGYQPNGPGGQTVIAGVSPGTYHVLANPIGNECIESITSGSSDLTRLDYVVPSAGSPQPITIALRSDCGSLQIAATQQSGQMFSVVIVGGPHALEPLAFFNASQLSVQLSPGDYEVFTFADANNIEYANPEVLKNYTGQHISVSPNQTVTLHPDAPDAGESH